MPDLTERLKRVKYQLEGEAAIEELADICLEQQMLIDDLMRPVCVVPEPGLARQANRGKR